jgi:hypothetical protein
MRSFSRSNPHGEVARAPEQAERSEAVANGAKCKRAVSNHEAQYGLILRDAAKTPLLRMRENT